MALPILSPSAPCPSLASMRVMLDDLRARLAPGSSSYYQAIADISRVAPWQVFNLCPTGRDAVVPPSSWLGMLAGRIGPVFDKFVRDHLIERTYYGEFVSLLPADQQPRFAVDLAQYWRGGAGAKIIFSLSQKPEWADGLILYTDEQIRGMSKLAALSLYYSLLPHMDGNCFAMDWTIPISQTFIHPGQRYDVVRYIYGKDLQKRIYALRPDLIDVRLPDGSMGQGLIDPELIERAIGGYGTCAGGDWTDVLAGALFSLFGMLSPFLSLASFAISLSRTISGLSDTQEQIDTTAELQRQADLLTRAVGAGAFTEPIVATLPLPGAAPGPQLSVVTQPPNSQLSTLNSQPSLTLLAGIVLVGSLLAWDE